MRGVKRSESGAEDHVVPYIDEERAEKFKRDHNGGVEEAKLHAARLLGELTVSAPHECPAENRDRQWSYATGSRCLVAPSTGAKPLRKVQFRIGDL